MQRAPLDHLYFLNDSAKSEPTMRAVALWLEAALLLLP